MLYYCQYKWHPHTNRQQVAKRIVERHDANGNNPQNIRGWYALAGGGAGFLLIETNTPQELTAFLQPYMDLVSFDCRAVYALEYEQQVQELRQVAKGT